MAEEWKWHDDDAKESVVIEAVRAIAVYTNPRGDIVIRQESTDHGDDDGVVVIPRASVGAILKAVKAEAAKPFTPDDE